MWIIIDVHYQSFEKCIYILNTCVFWAAHNSSEPLNDASLNSLPWYCCDFFQTVLSFSHGKCDSAYALHYMLILSVSSNIWHCVILWLKVEVSYSSLIETTIFSIPYGKRRVCLLVECGVYLQYLPFLLARIFQSHLKSWGQCFRYFKERQAMLRKVVHQVIPVTSSYHSLDIYHSPLSWTFSHVVLPLL